MCSNHNHEPEQILLPSEPAFHRRVLQGLYTPRAFVRAVLESDDYGQAFGVESWASGYAEPGYDEPKHGILFGNWNERTEYNRETRELKTTDRRPKRFADIAERAGYAVEWSDEWSTCEDCGKAIRTSPDSYSWSPSYALINDCSVVCAECLSESPEDYLSELIGDTNRCLSADLHARIQLEDFGFRRINDDDYESGWHPGQTDTPDKAIKALKASGAITDDTEFIFVQTEQSQFYTCWAVYVREPETDNNDGEEPTK